MKTAAACRIAAAPSRRGRLADFLFVGLGLMPLLVANDGDPALALLLFVPLLLAACLCGMWEQVESGPPGPAGANPGDQLKR